MQSSKLVCFCLLAFLTVCYSQNSLQKQFEQAFNLARVQWRYTNSEARIWGQKLLEKKAVFSDSTLLGQYRLAFDFAISQNGLRMDVASADGWAKALLIARGKIAPDKDMLGIVEEFLNNIPFVKKEGKKWCEDFLNSEEPFFSSRDMLSRYSEVYRLVRRNVFLALGDEDAHEMAQKFINSRFHFAANLSLLQQYRSAFDFARDQDTLQLQYKKARNWAGDFVARRGRLNGNDSLAIQLEEARNFAASRRGLKMKRAQARKWATEFLLQKGRFAPDQSLLNQFVEAFRLAANSDILNILRKLRQENPEAFLEERNKIWEKVFIENLPSEKLPKELFKYNNLHGSLVDEATKWAKNFLEKRSSSNIVGDLERQYINAVRLAFSSGGLKLTHLHLAENWAKEFIEKKID